MYNGYDLFVSQLENTCVEFPNLKIKSVEDKKYLKGVIDIPNSDKSFLIEIHYKDGFPYRFPKLFEVGGDIPCGSDWHKYSDSSCCITVEPDEILKCKIGISLSTFVNNEVIPHLANQLHRKITGKYLNEYSHHKEGLFEFFSELMKTTNKKLWCEYVLCSFGKKKINIARNEKCFCGSGIKFKKCHNVIFNKIREIGEKNMSNYLKEMELI